MKLRPDRVLGALLGMSIGDALGMPVEGWPRETVVERYGSIHHYLPRTFDDGTELAAGEFTDESEAVLCIVESYTANSGEIDPENIRARLEILARGESRRWMNPGTLALLDSDLDDHASSGDDAPVTGDVAARGIPLGLIAAGSPAHDPAKMKHQAAVLASLTHRTADAVDAVEVVGEAVRAVALQEIALPQLPSHITTAFPESEITSLLGSMAKTDIDALDFDAVFAEIGYGDAAAQVVAGAVAAASRAGDFEEAVFTAASQGGAADARAAIAGALAGAALGTAGIPQTLIDGLEGRVYVMLAAPWFFQTIQLRNAFAASDTKAGE